MKIDKNTVVQFHYRLRDEDDNNHELENSHSGQPVLYLHGAGNIIKGLEEAMAGHQAGDVFSVSVTPDKAYGQYQQGSQQRVPVKHLRIARNTRLKPGMVVHVETDNGPVAATVIKAGKFTVDIDTNHPLAGRQLGFDVEIVSVREASADEIAHRHAHGVGGHQH
ncbi:MAG TPA: peptidylprolyl isomerase [Pseudomonadales bacterium]